MTEARRRMRKHGRHGVERGRKKEKCLRERDMKKGKLLSMSKHGLEEDFLETHMANNAQQSVAGVEQCPLTLMCSVGPSCENQHLGWRSDN
eukprot:2109767-Amphidinium_carterae.1